MHGRKSSDLSEIKWETSTHDWKPLLSLVIFLRGISKGLFKCTIQKFGSLPKISENFAQNLQFLAKKSDSKVATFRPEAQRH